MKNNSININLKRDNIVLKIDDDTEYEKIIEELKRKLPELKKFYKEEKTPIKIIGKIFKNKEMTQIKRIINESIEVEVEFNLPRTLGLHSIKETFNKDIAISETKFHKGSLRSGRKIEVEGSLVIIGDVNSGAEVMATDNIVILGNLRGLAHAGAKGNKQAIIAAGMIDTVQIRIANIVKEIDREEEPMHKQCQVYINEEEIIIE